MKNGIWPKRIAALLLSALLCGCTVHTPAPSGPAALTAREDVLLELVNPAPDEDLLSYAPESPSIQNAAALGQVQPASLNFSDNNAEVRAVWISYLEMQTLLKNKTEAQFTKNICTVFDNVKSFGLNAVIVQVRPFADALYKSEYFPWSYTITGTEGKNPGYDPLGVMVREAKSRGLRIDAWVNPYRVRAEGNSTPLCSANQAKKWIDSGDSAVIQYGNFTSYNPADEKARKLIVNGIREIVKNYDVNGIHIDDYFYPTTDLAFDSSFYVTYKENGGKLSQADWRRANVEKLIKEIYTAVHEEDANVLFGVSPQGNISSNYNGQFIDMQKIASTPGYCDYVCPQVYYGFENQTQPFAKLVKEWNELVKDSGVELYIGLAAYKIGAADNWAGTGKNEWVNSTNKLQKMVESCRSLSNCNGFFIYRYDSLFRPASSVSAKVTKECDNLKKIL